MRKLTLLLALAGCAAQPISPNHNLERDIQQINQPVISQTPDSETVKVTYDFAHFRFECPGGEFEHAEFFDETGKKDFCLESLVPTEKPLPLYQDMKQKIYDTDWKANCDGKTDLIVVGFNEIKRPINILEGFYLPKMTAFNLADMTLQNFRRTYLVEKIREEWLKRKDSCRGTCNFEFLLK